MPPAGDGDDASAAGDGDDASAAGDGDDASAAGDGDDASAAGERPAGAEPDRSDAPHSVVLEFVYADERRASLVQRSVSQEVGEIEGDRTTATVDRDGATVVIDVRADDLVALRAGLNSWCTLVEVAERSSTAL